MTPTKAAWLPLLPMILCLTSVCAEARNGPEDAEVAAFMRDCGSDPVARERCERRFFDACSERLGNTTMGMIQCEGALADYWDRELNRVYQALMRRIQGSLKDSVRQTQRAWLTWRDQRCQPWGQMEGSLYRNLAADCRTETIRERVGDLETLLEHVGE
jgi:uncharacterized protein YecT (DUF1311 family)